MKTFRVEAMIRCAAFVQAANEEDAISAVAGTIEWPGGLLDEKYVAEECACSDVLDWMERRNQFCPYCENGFERKSENHGKSL